MHTGRKLQQESIDVEENVSINCGLINTGDHENDFIGIGVETSLLGKVIFITGATGFFGKVVVEKIPRTIPAVSKIYVLIRAKDKQAASQRLKNEIVDIELFKCIREMYGEHYEAFMMNKLVPVVGNVCESDLGLESNLAMAIMQDVQIILNSAGETSFDQRYDVGLKINAVGPYNLLAFAKMCKKLELFLHVSSTSIKRCSWQGRIMESLCMTDDDIKDETFISERFHPAVSFVENEMKLALDYQKTIKDDKLDHNMRELGLKRAKEFGWLNTYSFTKAIGEMLIEENRGEIPIVIARASGILSTYKEPFPGWIEGIKLIDPVILSYGKGRITGFLLNPNCVIDIIPADIVVNAILAAMAKHISFTKKGDINVYHIVTSISNPIVLHDCVGLFYQHFKKQPMLDQSGLPINVSQFKTFTSMEAFVAHLWREVTSMAIKSTSSNSSLLFERIKFIDRAKYLANLYAPYNLANYWFDDSNTRGLIKRMSKEEKMKFGCDVKSIKWEDYIVNVHIPGLRRHILREKGLSRM
ncbi:Male sterility, NAD-binding protein [Corchorus olitorius]|uniref:Fatty acyl-CoA reductase n=1 Tax=Corchorus olitorius TaxID=93759 RepID=A0A1R3HET3_9ROSI|nr:Male sterility, NAD-binding protein [Corchorus olitorius]